LCVVKPSDFLFHYFSGPWTAVFHCCCYGCWCM